MEVKSVGSVLGLVFLILIACSKQTDFAKDKIRDVYVKDFYSDKPAECTSADIPLNHTKAAEFFRQARILDYKTMSDNYPIAPCYIMGTLKYNNAPCEWRIYAGETGLIKCGKQEWYFACDTCDNLFK